MLTKQVADGLLADAALIVGAYLLGSLPVMRFIARLRHVDLSAEPDLHIATWRKVGPLEGAAGIIADMVKGAAAVLAGRVLGFGIEMVALAGLAVVVGQMWPMFAWFDGEKGNSTGLAMAATLDSIPLLLALVPIAIGASIRTAPRLADSAQPWRQRLKFGGPPSRSLPLGMIIGFAVLPLTSWLMGRAQQVTLVYLALFVLILLRRATARLRRDIGGNSNKTQIIFTRLLYDRSRL